MFKYGELSWRVFVANFWVLECRLATRLTWCRLTIEWVSITTKRYGKGETIKRNQSEEARKWPRGMGECSLHWVLHPSCGLTKTKNIYNSSDWTVKKIHNLPYIVMDKNQLICWMTCADTPTFNKSDTIQAYIQPKRYNTWKCRNDCQMPDVHYQWKIAVSKKITALFHSNRYSTWNGCGKQSKYNRRSIGTGTSIPNRIALTLPCNRHLEKLGCLVHRIL